MHKDQRSIVLLINTGQRHELAIRQNFPAVRQPMPYGSNDSCYSNLNQARAGLSDKACSSKPSMYMYMVNYIHQNHHATFLNNLIIQTMSLFFDGMSQKQERFYYVHLAPARIALLAQRCGSE